MSSNFKITQLKNGFRVDRVKEAQDVTTAIKDGAVTQTSAPISQVMPGMEDYSLCTAYYEGSGSWDLDHEAGVQRWSGSVSGAYLAHNLRRAGIEAAGAMKRARREFAKSA